MTKIQILSTGKIGQILFKIGVIFWLTFESHGSLRTAAEGSSGSRFKFFRDLFSPLSRVSVQGVESLWGDCRFIPADWGS